MSLMDDLVAVTYSKTIPGDPNSEKECAAFHRLYDFIKANEPWLPPRQPGFGPWIEYKPGDKGPHVGAVVSRLTAEEREGRHFKHAPVAAIEYAYGWQNGKVVAYCVKEDTP